MASVDALRALSQLDQSQIDALTAARRTKVSASVGQAPPGALDPTLSLPGRAFTIRADVLNSDGTSVSTEAVIRVTGDLQRPCWLLSWQEK